MWTKNPGKTAFLAFIVIYMKILIIKAEIAGTSFFRFSTKFKTKNMFAPIVIGIVNPSFRSSNINFHCKQNLLFVGRFFTKEITMQAFRANI